MQLLGWVCQPRKKVHEEVNTMFVVIDETLPEVARRNLALALGCPFAVGDEVDFRGADMVFLRDPGEGLAQIKRVVILAHAAIARTPGACQVLLDAGAEAVFAYPQDLGEAENIVKALGLPES